MNKTNFWAFLLLLPVAASAAHISETMSLENGWNAIYLESTPTNALCSDFFAGSPVVRVASYQSDAYSSTRQIADDGTEIAQKPISYYVYQNNSVIKKNVPISHQEGDCGDVVS